MKIAIASEDTTDVSRHFGRAPFYVVFSAENNELRCKEIRKKPCHVRESCARSGPCIARSAGIGDDSTHTYMALNIKDCEAIVAGGMGQGACYDFRSKGVEVVLTDLTTVDEVIDNYFAGKLVHCPERLH